MSHPLVNEKDAEHYVARLGQVSARMDEAIADARRLAAKGMFPPRFILRATIAQMRQFIAAPPAQNPFVAVFAERMAAVSTISGPREALRAEAERIVARPRLPGLAEGHRVARPAATRATDDAGLWRLGGGADGLRLRPAPFHDDEL